MERRGQPRHQCDQLELQGHHRERNALQLSLQCFQLLSVRRLQHRQFGQNHLQREVKELLDRACPVQVAVKLFIIFCYKNSIFKIKIKYKFDS